MMPLPSVTFLINSYNYGPFVSQAVESALSQDYPGHLIQVLVIDDGSTDDTPDRLRPYGGRISYSYKPNGGQASAFNRGFQEASGDIICLLDADDLALPNRARTIASTFARHPGCVAVYNRYNLAGIDGEPTSGPHPERLRTDGLRQRVQVWRGSGVPSSCIALSAAAARTVHVPEPAFRICADSYILAVLPLLGPVKHVDDVLTVYRLHGTNGYLSQDARKQRQMLTSRMSAVAQDMVNRYHTRPYMAPIDIPERAANHDYMGCLRAMLRGYADIWNRPVSMDIKLKESVKLPLYAIRPL